VPSLRPVEWVADAGRFAVTVRVRATGATETFRATVTAQPTPFGVSHHVNFRSRLMQEHARKSDRAFTTGRNTFGAPDALRATSKVVRELFAEMGLRADVVNMEMALDGLGVALDRAFAGLGEVR
jgi:hypothetical protein